MVKKMVIMLAVIGFFACGKVPGDEDNDVIVNTECKSGGECGEKKEPKMDMPEMEMPKQEQEQEQGCKQTQTNDQKITIINGSNKDTKTTPDKKKCNRCQIDCDRGSCLFECPNDNDTALCQENCRCSFNDNNYSCVCSL